MGAQVMPLPGAMRDVVPWRRQLVWMPLAAASVLGVVTFGLLLASGRAAVPAGVTISLAYTGVGSWIAAHKPRQGLVPVLWTVGVTQAVVEASYAYATYALDAAPGTLPGGPLAAWLSDWLWFPGYLLMLTLVLLLFPDGRVPSRRWRPVAWVVWSAIALMFVGALTTLPNLPMRSSVAVTGEGEALAELLGGGAFFAGLACVPVCLASLIVRWRRSSGVQRRQLKTFVLGAVVSVALLLAGGILPELEGVPSALFESLAAIAFAAAIGVAVVRHQLFDVDVVLNRGLVYAILTGLVAGGYVGVVAAS